MLILSDKLLLDIQLFHTSMANMIHKPWMVSSKYVFANIFACRPNSKYEIRDQCHSYVLPKVNDDKYVKPFIGITKYFHESCIFRNVFAKLIICLLFEFLLKGKSFQLRSKVTKNAYDF